MKNKSILIILFVLVVIAQLFVPIQMIRSQEDTVSTGKILKFQTQPIDPYDAFRGKYIFLNFKNDRIRFNLVSKDIKDEDDIFVTFRDSAGFALIKSVSATKPASTSDYIKAKVGYIDGKFAFTKQSDRFLHIKYPFDRYYMNEDKAYDAEVATRDLTKNVYAEVAIKDGVGVVKDVFVDGVPIKDFVKSKKP